MDKQQLAERLAKHSRQSRANAADKLDALIHKLWKESKDVKPKRKDGESPAHSTVPAKKS